MFIFIGYLLNEHMTFLHMHRTICFNKIMFHALIMTIFTHDCQVKINIVSWRVRSLLLISDFCDNTLITKLM